MSSLNVKEQQVLALTSSALSGGTAGGATDHSQQLLGELSVDPDLDPSHIAQYESVRAYLERNPGSRLAARVSAFLSVRAAADEQGYRLKRLVGKVTKITPRAYFLQVTGKGVRGMMNAGASIVVTRAADKDGIVMYEIYDYGGSQFYARLLRPSYVPETGQLADIYITPKFVDLGGVRVPSPELLGLWYAQGETRK